MRSLVTGATGFLGRRLVAALPGPVRVLSRDPAHAQKLLGDAVEPFAWIPEAGPPPAAALDGVEVIFHLAGESVAGRWSKAKRESIRESRVRGTRNLVAAAGALSDRPRVLVSASAVGVYGPRGEEILDESTPVGPDDDFLASVCRSWEEEAGRARTFGLRVVTPRIGIVLGPGGGALAKMLTPFRLGLGGRLGSGQQWMPWVHLDDVVGLLLHAAAKSEIDGPLNAVAPEPARNVEFTRALAKVLGRPAFLPAPAFALRLAIGEFANAILGSQRVVPRVAESTGYRFAHPILDEALRSALDRGDAITRPPPA
ncbi:MAG: TIGR01777 family protein [Myxococcales bacterium]|nr:TIGR01777 family protein [Myxococcales bacterium]